MTNLLHLTSCHCLKLYSICNNLTACFCLGAVVIPVHAPLGYGDNFSPDILESVIRKNTPKLLFIVQGESSSGVYQPLEGLGEICER